MSAEYKILNSNTVINLSTGKEFTLNSTGMTFIEKYLELGYQNAVKNLSKLYNADTKRIENDLYDLIKSISSNDSEKDVGYLPYNNYVVLEPTNNCSAGCIHCFHKFDKKISWDRDKIEEYIKYLTSNNIFYVSITGGEIFSPHYIENAKYLITRLNENGIKISTISTNGLFLNDNLASWIRNNINLDDTVFRVSYDAADTNRLYKIRPGYSKYFNLNYWNIMNRYNFRVIVTTIISIQTEQEVVNIAKFLAKQNCVKKWLLKPMIPTQAKQYSLINWKQIVSDYTAFLNWYKSNKQQVQYDFTLGNIITKDALCKEQTVTVYNNSDHPCKNEVHQITIKANGNITRCPIIPEICANMETPIERTENYNEVLFNDLTIDEMVCKSCIYKPICGGGCRAYALAFSGDVKKCDINSKVMFDWIFNEKYFKAEWKTLYDNMVREIEN